MIIESVKRTVSSRRRVRAEMSAKRQTRHEEGEAAKRVKKLERLCLIKF